MKQQAVADEGEAPVSNIRTKFVPKRALRDKSLAVSFDEKDLRDFVGGFHKRKKKRRKEAEIQIQDKLRRKRIELRKKRKLDRDFVQNGPPQPVTESIAEEGNDDDEQDVQDEDADGEHISSLSGTTTYDNGDLKVIVTTSEISREEDETENTRTPTEPREHDVVAEKKHKIPVIKKKPMKKVPKHRSSHNKLKKRDKKKMGGHKNKKSR